LVRICSIASVGPRLLVRICSIVSVGPHLFDRICETFLEKRNRAQQTLQDADRRTKKKQPEPEAPAIEV
jgi:hypothetical protein